MERWFQQTLSDLERHEGFRPYPYPDPLSEIAKKYPPSKYRWGFVDPVPLLTSLKLDPKDGTPWTIGYGNTVGVTINDVTTKEFARKDLSRELSSHLSVLDRLLPEWKVYPDFAKTVLANLAYNMGNRLGQFRNTLNYIKAKQWNQAAVNLEKSLWYKQVGVRAPELVERLRKEMIQPKYLVKGTPDFSNVEAGATSTEEVKD